MNIIILGGNGFIGSNLANYLCNQGYCVISLDLVIPTEKNDKIMYIEGNFFNEEEIKPYLLDAEVVFHAISSINPGNSNIKYMQGYSYDFLQSVKLAQFSKEYGFKLIYLSSGGTVYGFQEKMPIEEDTLSVPVNHYGNLKLCIENTYRTFNAQSGTDIKIARIANPYGPGQDYMKGVGFIDAVLKRASRNEIVEIYGDGKIIRDYIYIDDVSGMLEKMMLYDGDEVVFNIGTGVGTSQNDILNIVKTLVSNIEVSFTDARPIDVPRIILDNKKIMKLYNRKCVPIEAGIAQYYSYMVLGLR